MAQSTPKESTRAQGRVPYPSEVTVGATDRIRGLSSAEVAVRLEQYGRNELPPVPPIAWWRRVLLQLRDPLIVVLLVAAVLTVATGDHTDAVIIAVVVVANTAVGVIQEMKADSAIAALHSLTAPAAKVVRDGVVSTVDAGDVVPGDLVVVGEGDIVPADGTLVDAAALLVDESALTGESVPAEKDSGDGQGGELAAGTVVVHGRGRAIVTRTGSRSAMGRIAAALAAPPTLTPLQRHLAGLGRVLAGVAVALCLVVLAIGLSRGQPVERMVVTAISLVVAAVPESLPAVVTLSLALGARRMAARHAIVRRLPAVETLGAVTVIATDKTGTLTEGEMVVERAWTPQREVRFTGGGFAPRGTVVADQRELAADEAPDLERLLRAGVLCNDAELQPPESDGGRWRAVGDPTEAALIAAAGKLGLDAVGLRGRSPRLREEPFDSVRKRMTTVHRVGDGSVLVACKGAPEQLLTPALLADPEPVLAEARAQADGYARAGLRVLAVASARLDKDAPLASATGVPLHLAGLLALADPLRPAAAGTVADFRAAGITPVLITGDHLATARHIAGQVGLLDTTDGAVAGTDLAEVPDPREVAVFARTDPSTKLELVRGWQRQGHVVAMQGDGVNDAPSLHQADIGVAMGGRGTEIARQAADLVLTDDNLETVVAAVEEGRRVYANVRRFLLYALAGGTAEILVMLLGPAFGMELPLLPAQILWINLLTHGLPGVAMGAEPGEPGAMRRPPRPPAQSVLGAGLWWRVLSLAVVVTAGSVAVGWWGHHHAGPWQSMLFLALGMLQFGIALGVRARPDLTANPFLLVAVAASFALQLAGVYLAPLRSLLDTQRPSAATVLVLCALSVVGYVAARVVRRAAT